MTDRSAAQSKPADRSPTRTRRVGRMVLLALILLAGAYVRFAHLNWDEGQWIHPDEGHMRSIVSIVQLPEDARLYFRTSESPLNPRNAGQRYSYGTLPLFLTRTTAEWLDSACRPEAFRPLGRGVATLLVGGADEACAAGRFTGGRSAIVGRALSALSDVGTLVLIYLIGRRLYGEAVGLIAVALGAFTAFMIQQAHFFTVDSMAAFFTLLTAYLSMRAAGSGGWGVFAWAGLTTGLATACKVSAAPAALLVALAGVTWLWKRGDWSVGAIAGVIVRLMVAGLLALVAFRIAQPYAFEGPGFFGVRPSIEWFERLGQIRHEQSGEVDYPSGRQWTDRTPVIFALKDMVFWGMGLPLGLTAWAGWALMGLELWRGRRKVHLTLWGWSTIVFLYHATRWVKTMRSFLPLYPLFIIFAAYLLVRLIQASRRAGGRSGWRHLGLALTLAVVTGTLLWGWAFFSIYRRSHTRLVSSRWIFEHVPEGSTLATEHWDWPPPLRVDGRDPYAGAYSGLEMTLYDEDTVAKREKMVQWLDQADYIITGSNRLYASISRLPPRYPMTIEYYRALFAGELGFELVADFTSRPALGPFQFPDQETPFPLMEPTEFVYQTEPIEVYVPPADEAWSVYDHPRVLIFRKTADYSTGEVERILGAVDLDRVLHGLTPVEATATPNALRYEPETWAEQRAGGTWSEMFNRQRLFNRHPGLAAVAWWGVVTVLGWAVFPILFVSLPGLRDRGYGLARILALLLLAYLTWLAASLRLLPNTRGTIFRVVLWLVVVGGGIGWLKHHSLRRFLRRRWRTILWMEFAFALLYVGWIGVRLLHPDLWHVVFGGEKPMDFAYFNAVMKSTWFPPYNPWFSGTYVNYYYFGFVIVGSLTKLMATVPAIAYNLALPLLFALTGLGAFSVAYNLSRRDKDALTVGAFGLLFVLLIGNLGVIQLIVEKLIDLGGGDALFPSTVPGLPEAVAAARGLWQLIVRGASLPVRIEAWYWEPTRIIPAPPTEAGPITEFPAFTFLYGDLHAHMVALPLTLLALAVAIYWAKARRPRWPSFLIGALAIGALQPTNTWDYPTYLVLGVVGLLVGAWAWRHREKRLLRRLIVWIGGLVILSSLLYLPYIRHYARGYSSVRLWEGSRTPVKVYALIHGIFLFPLLTRLAMAIRRVWHAQTRWARLGTLGLLIVFVAAGAVLAIRAYPVAIVVMPVSALAGWLILSPNIAPRRRFLWLVFGLAMALTLVVEIVVLEGDIARMNTVFKFYLQVWVLLGVAAAASLPWVWGRARRWRLPDGRWVWGLIVALLILNGALFLPFSIRSRATDRIADRTGATLDGMVFMEDATITAGPPERQQAVDLIGDYYAIRQMQDQIQGSPVIIEGLGYREYLWANRVSIYTGLPAVVGWRWHQVQQRATLPSEMVDERRSDVETFYNTTDIDAAWEILRRYDVRYVYVGGYERAYYTAQGLAKFEQMAERGLLRLRYDAFSTQVYEVLEQ